MVWVIVAVAGWAAVAVLFGLVLGRAIRASDQWESPGIAAIPAPRRALAGP